MSKYLERDKQVLWHPFTQMKDWMANPQIVIADGEGDTLIDAAGKKYIDGVASLWCNVHGHRKIEIDTAIKRQLNRIAHSTMLGMTHIPGIELAERIIEIAPQGLKRVFYSDSGSEAVEIALKMAFQYWQHRGKRYAKKMKFVALKDAYHGDTVGAVSVGGIDLFHSLFKPLLFDAYFAPSPNCYRCPMDEKKDKCKQECLKALEKILKARASEVAALIIEPLVQGAGGMIVAPEGYLTEVRKLCTKYKILMIADEVAVGFGRTGRMFACDHEGISPDLMTIAKGLTGGYLPLAATLATEEIFEQFLGAPEEHKTFFHGHTYTGNQLACAAALANLDVFEQEGTLTAIQPKIELLAAKLEPLRKLSHVGDVRQRGLIAGIELVAEKKGKKSFHEKERIGHKVCLAARKQGLLIRPLGDVIVIFPPLCITNEHLGQMTDIIHSCIKEVCGE